MGPRPQVLPTLDVFIQQSLALGTPGARHDWIERRAFVRCHGFALLYVRMQPRLVNGVAYHPVLVLADVKAQEPGKGTFTRLVARLRKAYPNLHLYAELVHNVRLCTRLESMGFARVEPFNPFDANYFLQAPRGY